MYQPIFVTGAARSGTSLTAGLLDKHGVFGGKTIPGNANNPKGFFEHRDIREHIVKTHLKLLGADDMGQNPLPNYFLADPELRTKVISIMKRDGLQAHQTFYYKGAKLCLIWKTWQEAFPNAKWIIVRRPDEQIISSCNRTHFMFKRKDWDNWLDFHKEMFYSMKEECDCREVWTNKLIDGDYTEIKEVLPEESHEPAGSPSDTRK